jgi:hypothetical protein
MVEERGKRKTGEGGDFILEERRWKKYEERRSVQVVVSEKLEFILGGNGKCGSNVDDESF